MSYKFRNVGIACAVGFGIWNGYHTLAPEFEREKNERALKDSSSPASPSSPSGGVVAMNPLGKPPTPPTSETEEQKRQFLKSILPSTVVAPSAHPDHAAKIMDSPLPAMLLTAKKIPTREEAGEMQAEPYAMAEASN